MDIKLETAHINILEIVNEANSINKDFNIFKKGLLALKCIYHIIKLNKKILDYLDKLDFRDMITEFAIFSCFSIKTFGKDNYYDIVKRIKDEYIEIEDIYIIPEFVYDVDRLSGIGFKFNERTKYKDIYIESFFDFEYENKVKFKIKSMEIKVIDNNTNESASFIYIYDAINTIDHTKMVNLTEDFLREAIGKIISNFIWNTISKCMKGKINYGNKE